MALDLGTQVIDFTGAPVDASALYTEFVQVNSHPTTERIEAVQEVADVFQVTEEQVEDILAEYAPEQDGERSSSLIHPSWDWK